MKTPEEQMRLYKEMTVGSAMTVRDLASHVQQKKTNATGKPGATMDDRELRSIEDRLQGALGTKVKIQRRAKGVRMIVIETYSDEEFKQVIRRLSK
jgi:hypothetical protein